MKLLQTCCEEENIWMFLNYYATNNIIQPYSFVDI